MEVISDHIAEEAELTEEESIGFRLKFTILLSLVYKHTFRMFGSIIYVHVSAFCAELQCSENRA